MTTFPQPCPAHISAADVLRAMLAILARQQRIVTELKALAAEQRSLIAAGRHDALLRLIARRQGLVDELVQTQGALAPLTEAFNEQSPSPAPGARQQVRQLIDQISAGLVEIADADQADERSLLDGCKRVQSELASLGAGQAARHAYIDRQQPPNRFTDRKG